MTKQLVWKLPDYLEAHGLTRYELMQELGDGKGRVAYKWKNLPDRLDTEALARVLGALEKLTGGDVAVTDLLEYAPPADEDDEDDRAWLDADLSRLGEIEPYEWGEGELEEWDTVRYVPGQGLVVAND